MDNLTIRFKDVRVDLLRVQEILFKLKVPASHKTIPRLNEELLMFSLPIGPHQSRWLFRCSLKNNTVTCSGGVTKTFFGHNLWVFKNEATQLRAIIGILTEELARTLNIRLPSDENAMTVEHAELTRHFAMPESWTKAHAIHALSEMFKARFPKRYFLNDATNDKPGTTGLGLNKSSRVCRVYDPVFKFAQKPTVVPVASWEALCTECKDHLRIEIIFHARELKSAGLDMVAAWESTPTIDSLLDKRYKDYCLTVQFVSIETLLPSDVEATRPGFVEAARYFFTNGERGKPIPPDNGSLSRFKRYMSERGYCVDVPFAHHPLMEHGLHDILQLQHAVKLSEKLRQDKHLFEKWWDTKR